MVVEKKKGEDLICIIGRPLVGKSIVAKKIAEFTGWHYFSSGDYVRELGIDLENTTKHDVSIRHNQAVIDKVGALPWNTILDGYPRHMSQIHIGADVIALIMPWAVIKKRKRNREDDGFAKSRMQAFDSFLLEAICKRKIHVCLSQEQLYARAIQSIRTQEHWETHRKNAQLPKDSDLQDKKSESESD